MKVGYPCLNLSINKVNQTFRLKSYSDKRLIETVENNLSYLLDMLKFNVENNLLFFRISSDLVPFASHPVCNFNWENHFKEKFQALGNFIKRYGIRISMHPDQFTLINSQDENVYERSVAELLYHTKILDLMELDLTAKIQIHVGGVYGNKDESITRFIRRFQVLDNTIKRRLVIENDDRLYNLRDCYRIHIETGVPILFDAFHHELNNSGEVPAEAFHLFSRTWKKEDGIPMVDYSSQEIDTRRGTHTLAIDTKHFEKFINDTKNFDFDLMLEIKNKESSALKAVEILSDDIRFMRALKGTVNCDA
ncbi:MAG TPA: UV DNA damage repair endonuclease UvsE [Thermodesulfobacteriota bacterium]|nr:UV DNA damage repair endonuclease UvsE [Thermodesulfobacteriota bacterium]